MNFAGEFLLFLGLTLTAYHFCNILFSETKDRSEEVQKAPEKSQTETQLESVLPLIYAGLLILASIAASLLPK